MLSSFAMNTEPSDELIKENKIKMERADIIQRIEQCKSEPGDIIQGDVKIKIEPDAVIQDEENIHLKTEPADVLQENIEINMELVDGMHEAELMRMIRDQGYAVQKLMQIKTEPSDFLLSKMETTEMEVHVGRYATEIQTGSKDIMQKSIVIKSEIEDSKIVTKLENPLINAKPLEGVMQKNLQMKDEPFDVLQEKKPPDIQYSDIRQNSKQSPNDVLLSNAHFGKCESLCKSQDTIFDDKLISLNNNDAITASSSACNIFSDDGVTQDKQNNIVANEANITKVTPQSSIKKEKCEDGNETNEFPSPLEITAVSSGFELLPDQPVPSFTCNIFSPIVQYTCGHCDKSFEYLEDVKLHMANHDGQPAYKCNQCQFFFEAASRLYHHMNIHAGGQCICSQCGCRFKHNISLKKHVKRHSSAQRYKCKSCSYTTNQIYYMSQHMSVHTKNQLLKCEQCDYTCVRASTIKKHIRGHALVTLNDPNLTKITRKKVQKLYKCTECDFICTTSSSLTQHKNKHSSVKMYKCTKCDYSSHFNSSLNRHMQTLHSSERIYKCEQCDYTCKHKTYLKRHVLSKHTKNNDTKAITGQ